VRPSAAAVSAVAVAGGGCREEDVVALREFPLSL